MSDTDQTTQAPGARAEAAISWVFTDLIVKHHQAALDRDAACRARLAALIEALKAEYPAEMEVARAQYG